MATAASYNPVNYNGINADYEGRKRSYTNQWAAQRAANDYARTLAQQRGTRTIAGVQDTWRRKLNPLQGGFARRNWLDSGTYQQAMTDYAKGAYTAENDARQNLAGQLRNYDLQNKALYANYQTQLADALAAKNQRIQDTAAQLQAMKLYGGK